MKIYLIQKITRHEKNSRDDSYNILGAYSEKSLAEQEIDKIIGNEIELSDYAKAHRRMCNGKHCAFIQFDWGLTADISIQEHELITTLSA